jgi:putative membrane protein
MAVTGSVRQTIRARPITVTAVLSVIGYALVIGTFAGVLNIYPDLSQSTVNLLSHLIAVINTTALAALGLGVYYIKDGDYERHRAAMVTAFVLILLFLVVYLLKIGGGTEKSIIAPDLVTIVYLIMLAIHIVLSVVSVPVVLYVVLLGLTHSPTELAETRKAQVGRIAASAWILSLFLGIVTYLLLNHVYASEPRDALLILALAPVSASELVSLASRKR